MEKTYDYKNNPIVRKIFYKMLIPTILMNLTTALASFADTIIIGYFLDETMLSVVTFATPIYMIINTFAALYAVGGSIVMSVDSGKGDKKAANKSFSLSIELLAATGIILVCAGMFLSSSITKWLGAGPEVFEMVRSYSTIVLLGAPIFMLNIGLAFFVRNDGRPTLSMLGMFLSIAVNIVFDIVFIGAMDMGVAGAAYATVLGQLVSALVIASHFLSSKNTLKFSFVFNRNTIRIVKNGASTALHFIYQFITILIINNYIGQLAGNNGVVVYTVVFNLCTVSLALFEGLSQTIQPMVSLYYGERSYRNIKNTLRLVLKAAVVICGTITIVLEMFPQIVPIMFDISGESLMAESVMAVRIYATSMIIMTVNVILGYYLQSTEQSLMSSVLVSFRCFILFLGSVFLLGELIGINGVWGAYTLAECGTFLIFVIMSRIKKKQLLKQNIEVDFFLLNAEIQEGIRSYTYSSIKDDIIEYKAKVISDIQNGKMISAMLCKDMEEYLDVIATANVTKGKYIEIEINEIDQKIIVRDNLNNVDIESEIDKKLIHGSKYEYGPVFGWNRICIERGDNRNEKQDSFS